MMFQKNHAAHHIFIPVRVGIFYCFGPSFSNTPCGSNREKRGDGLEEVLILSSKGSVIICASGCVLSSLHVLCPQRS